MHSLSRPPACQRRALPRSKRYKVQTSPRRKMASRTQAHRNIRTIKARTFTTQLPPDISPPLTALPQSDVYSSPFREMSCHFVPLKTAYTITQIGAGLPKSVITEHGLFDGVSTSKITDKTSTLHTSLPKPQMKLVLCHSLLANKEYWQQFINLMHKQLTAQGTSALVYSYDMRDHGSGCMFNDCSLPNEPIASQPLPNISSHPIMSSLQSRFSSSEPYDWMTTHAFDLQAFLLHVVFNLPSLTSPHDLDTFLNQDTKALATVVIGHSMGGRVAMLHNLHLNGPQDAYQNAMPYVYSASTAMYNATKQQPHDDNRNKARLSSLQQCLAQIPIISLDSTPGQYPTAESFLIRTMLAAQGHVLARRNPAQEQQNHQATQSSSSSPSAAAAAAAAPPSFVPPHFTLDDDSHDETPNTPENIAKRFASGHNLSQFLCNYQDTLTHRAKINNLDLSQMFAALPISEQPVSPSPQKNSRRIEMMTAAFAMNSNFSTNSLYTLLRSALFAQSTDDTSLTLQHTLPQLSPPLRFAAQIDHKYVIQKLAAFSIALRNKIKRIDDITLNDIIPMLDNNPQQLDKQRYWASNIEGIAYKYPDVLRFPLPLPLCPSNDADAHTRQVDQELLRHNIPQIVSSTPLLCIGGTNSSRLTTAQYRDSLQQFFPNTQIGMVNSGHFVQFGSSGGHCAEQCSAWIHSTLDL